MKINLEITIEEIVDLVLEISKEDPLDWDVFANGKEHAIKLVASSVIEQFNKEYVSRDDRAIILSTITKLLVENMILHTQLLRKDRK